MWKVSNDKNKVKLDKFKAEIIDKFWKILLERLENKVNDKIEEAFILDSKEIIILKSPKVFIKEVLRRKIDKESLLGVMTAIVEKHSFREIKEEFNNYENQNNRVDLLDFNIKEIEVIKEMKKIFNDFFYEKFFSDNKIWNYIDSINFTRNDFHINFLNENKINVCPYCDIETIYLEGNRYIEHFLPQSKFPYLSMNPNNLASVCSSCNGTATGKGSGIKNPIVSLYNKQIGDEIKFELIKEEKLIKLNTIIEENKNYIDLLKLQKKYENSLVFDDLSKRLDVLYEILEDNDEEKHEKYIKSYRTLYFATKSILKELSKYKEIKNHAKNNRPIKRNQI